MAENDAEDTLLTLTADIVAAHVSNNSVAVNDLPNLIQNVHSALSDISRSGTAPEPKPEPKVSIRSSVKPDYIVCLEDGKKLKMLKRHLMTHYNINSRAISAEVGPFGRLSDGRSELRRAAPDARQVDRPGYEAAPHARGEIRPSAGRWTARHLPWRNDAYDRHRGAVRR